MKCFSNTWPTWYCEGKTLQKSFWWESIWVIIDKRFPFSRSLTKQSYTPIAFYLLFLLWNAELFFVFASEILSLIFCKLWCGSCHTAPQVDMFMLHPSMNTSSWAHRSINQPWEVLQRGVEELCQCSWHFRIWQLHKKTCKHRRDQNTFWIHEIEVNY